ncbi:MAG: CDGSH iron-sulfur domain-containing protein [Salinivirgaceae bacterium]|nr:CDGSH iron-sulfur domain-containing protein [Salinivirgaceae bacterium]
MEESKKTKVTAIANGPLMIEGNFIVKGVDGNLLASADKMFLCRCGKSNNKPFCDGSHNR